MAIECPFDSLATTMATDARDWSLGKRDAWLWGIVCGWDDEDSGDTEAMEEVAERQHWTPETVARLRRLRKAFFNAEKMSSELRDARLIAMSSANRATAEQLGEAWGISLEGADDAGGLHEQAAEAQRRALGESTDGGPF